MSWNPAANNNSFTDTSSNNNNRFVDTSKFLNLNYNSSPFTYTSDTSSAGLNDPIPTSGSFMDSMKTKGNPYSSSTGGAAKGFDTLGWFGAGAQGLSAIGSLMQAYNGAKQVQLGRDTFNFQKSAFNQDAANQAKMVNSELEDRQKSRISSTGNGNALGAYEGLDSYMNKNRVSVSQLG